MRSLSEQDVRAAMRPVDVFTEVREFLLGPSWRSAVADALEDDGPAAPVDAPRDVRWRPAVKAGRIGEVVGLRLRPYDEGGYVTACWDGPDAEPILVSSTWLTYLRTAAMLLLGPAEDPRPGDRVVVLGRGRLGLAVLELAHAVLPDATITSWAPTERRRPAVDALGVVQCTSGASVPIGDIAIFATSAPKPIDLSPAWCSATRWICYGGPHRIGQQQLDAVGRVEWSDDPARCTALGLSTSARPLRELLSGASVEPTARHLLWACGGGPVDVHLARAALGARIPLTSGAHE